MIKIESELIQQTILFWEQYSGTRLSVQEAREAVANLSGFFVLLNEWEGREREADVNKPADEGEQQ